MLFSTLRSKAVYLAFSLGVLHSFFSACSPVATEKSEHPLASMGNDMILDLNNLTYTIANQHDQFYSFIGVRALAMTHLAMHDLFNTVYPQFEIYRFHHTDSTYNAIVAGAEAVKNILIDAYPERTDTITAVCEKWIATVEEGHEKDRGLEAGRKAAAFYLEFRAHDGHEAQGDYTPMTKPGSYQYTGADAWVWKPDFSVVRPFVLDSVSQFRSPPPPTLTSEEYTGSYQEVKAYGCKNSTARTEDQTNYAHWWAEFGEHGWNRIGRLTAAEKELSLNETNRMFALLNTNLYDLYLASFDSKYLYDTWRPVTAIHAAETDGNPNTEPDTSWQPEMITPPWPDYPSTHAAVGSAGAEIVTQVYGTPEVAFTMQSVTALPGALSRHYENLDSAAMDCADSRVMNGYHFRFATVAGRKQGREIAKHTVATILRPRNQ